MARTFTGTRAEAIQVLLNLEHPLTQAGSHFPVHGWLEWRFGLDRRAPFPAPPWTVFDNLRIKTNTR